MPRHRNLTLKKFLDSIPESLIKEYFEKRNGNGVPSSLKSFDYESVNKFLGNMKEEPRNEILEDFTHINDICEMTMNILVTAVQRYNIETTGDEKRQQLAMDVFLHHERAFNYAYSYYCLFNSSSKLSNHNLPTDHFEINPEKINDFKAKVSDFYLKLAKGSECDVKYHDGDDEVIIVVIHGSYSRSEVIWKDQDIETIFFRPAKEDILRFNRNTSILSIKAPYQRDRENYISTFAEAILGDKTQAERKDRDATYTLAPLQDGTFCFAGNEQITSITLLEVKLAIRGFTNPTIEVKSSDVMETLEADIDGISLNSGDLVHAKFRFRIKEDRKERNVTFEITPPNVTDLTKKRHADIIGDYLKENGVKLV